MRLTSVAVEAEAKGVRDDVANAAWLDRAAIQHEEEAQRVETQRSKSPQQRSRGCAASVATPCKLANPASAAMS